MTSSIEQTRIEAVLALLRPYIESDGGGIELVNVQEGTVYIRMLGACVGCPASAITQQMVIEKQLKEQVPGITNVVVVD